VRGKPARQSVFWGYSKLDTPCQNNALPKCAVGWFWVAGSFVLWLLSHDFNVLIILKKGMF